jgi:hypothetical protein
MSISQNVGAVSTPASTRVTGPTVTALRWHMRIAGAVLLLLMILGISMVNNLFSFITLQGPNIVVAVAAITGSFGRRVNWLLAVVLTLTWGILDYIFIFGGPNGPGLIFEIAGGVIAASGIVIAALSFQAFARDF